MKRSKCLAKHCKALWIIAFCIGLLGDAWAQKKQNGGSTKAGVKAQTNNQLALKRLDSLFITINTWCSIKPNDNLVKQILADKLKTNKAFLQEWEIGLNDKDAQIWHLLCHLSQYPYVIDSSKGNLVCKMPAIKNEGKLAESKGVLQIVPAALLDVDNSHDVILSKPDATSKPLGKVKPGERYSYFPGATGYSTSLKKYVTYAYKDDSEGGNNYYAIILDAAKRQLGYIIANATWLSYPQVQLQYSNNSWKITSINYQ